MLTLKNDRFLRALRKETVDRTPVWLMRQAGRYLPEYRATRARAGSFMDLCRNTELATEVTLQPLERYDLDAAILFSDILTIPDAMGLGLTFAEGEGPRFAKPLRTEADIMSLAAPDPNVELRYVMDAVSSIRRALADRVPLIGFSGSPFTLACYMVDGGGGSDGFRHTKTLMYQRPDLLHRILSVNADAVTQYLSAQIEAGAQVAMVFDSWGGLLTPGAYLKYSLPYMQSIVDSLRHRHAGVPIILFSKGAHAGLPALSETGCDALGIDWTLDLNEAKLATGGQVGLQGNLDPAVLFGSPAQIEAEVAGVLSSFGHGHEHIFNLGHGISQHTPPENVSIMLDALHRLSPAWHTTDSPA